MPFCPKLLLPVHCFILTFAKMKITMSVDHKRARLKDNRCGHMAAAVCRKKAAQMPAKELSAWQFVTQALRRTTMAACFAAYTLRERLGFGTYRAP